MATSPPRFVVIGAGGVGTVLGARLMQSGHDVRFVVRPAQADHLREHPLVLHDPETTNRLDVVAVRHPGEIDFTDRDVVVLATKSQDALEALDALADCTADVPVVCATNGIETERVALRRFARVYGMSVVVVATHLEVGVVAVHTSPLSGQLDVGRYPTGTDDVSQAVQTSLARSGFDVRHTADVMRSKRWKLLLNLKNCVHAACGVEVDASALKDAAIAEGVALFEALGLDCDPPELENAGRPPLMPMKPAAGITWSGGSTWQGLRRGNPRHEIDYLNGEIVLLGRLHGFPTPVNERLQEVGRELSRGSPLQAMSPELVLGSVDTNQFGGDGTNTPAPNR